MPLKLNQLFQLESHLENSFRDGLVSEQVVADASRVYISRTSDLGASPRIELKAIVGEVQNHQHLFPDESFTWDAWAAQIEALVVTNRTTESAEDTHHAMLGRLRACLMPLYTRYNTNPLWWWKSDAVQITDIREQGTEDTFVSDDDLDYSKLRYYCIFNIVPDAWPITTP